MPKISSIGDLFVRPDSILSAQLQDITEHKKKNVTITVVLVCGRLRWNWCVCEHGNEK